MNATDFYVQEQDDGAGHQQQLEEMQRLDREEQVDRVFWLLAESVQRPLKFSEVMELKSLCGL